MASSAFASSLIVISKVSDLLEPVEVPRPLPRPRAPPLADPREVEVGWARAADAVRLLPEGAKPCVR